MVIVIHPLIDRRGLFADGLERGMRVQQGESRGEPAVGVIARENQERLMQNRREEEMQVPADSIDLTQELNTSEKKEETV